MLAAFLICLAVVSLIQLRVLMGVRRDTRRASFVATQARTAAINAEVDAAIIKRELRALSP